MGGWSTCIYVVDHTAHTHMHEQSQRENHSFTFLSLKTTTSSWAAATLCVGGKHLRVTTARAPVTLWNVDGQLLCPVARGERLTCGLSMHILHNTHGWEMGVNSFTSLRVTRVRQRSTPP